MLVLSRKTRQQIRIGDNITVTILLVKGQTVRVGIEAPREVRVLRAELPVHDEQHAAAVECESTSGGRRGGARTTAGEASEAKPYTATSVLPSANDTDPPGLTALRRRSRIGSLTRTTERGDSLGLRPLFRRH